MSRLSKVKGALKYILARLQKKTRMSAVRSSQIHPTSAIESGSQVVGVIMDRHSFCGYDCALLNADIGPFCSIADQVYVGGSAHPVTYVSTSPVFLSHRDSVRTKLARHDFYEFPRTTIKADVWIGFRAHIRAGVTIGQGAVIGMGAVVTKDVPPYTIVGGNPARFIADRFDPAITARLLATRWWERDDAVLAKLGDTIPDPAAFLDALEAL